MSRRLRRAGFTLVELMIAILVLVLMTMVSWNLMRGGLIESMTASEHLSAIQNAMILMESIQEDVRQIAILNDAYGSISITAPLLEYSINFSRNKKSCMFRKSALKNSKGVEQAGAAFTVVTYQLVKRTDSPDCYSIRRIERSADGTAVGNQQHTIENKAFSSLVLKDVVWDFETRLEGMALFRTFLRVSITVVNTALAPGQMPTNRDPKYYFLSNVYELESPEPLHSTLKFPAGFAKKFMKSNQNLDPNSKPIFAGIGNFDKLNKSFPDPNNWTDDPTNPLKGWDFFDGSANQNFKFTSTQAGADPFDYSNFAAPVCRQQVVDTSVQYLENILNSKFRGKVVGTVLGPRVPGQQPWGEKFSLDCSEQAKDTLAVQIDQYLTQKIFPHGAAGVCEMAHYFNAFSQKAAELKPPTNLPASVAAVMMTTGEASVITQGQ